MGWNAGVTRTTGDLITAADWNKYLGASGSLEYLKTEQDTIKGLLDNCTLTEPTRAFDTIYQNGSKIRIVIAVIALSPDEWCQVYIGSSSSPTYRGDFRTDLLNDTIVQWLTFVVPPNWYYEITSYRGSPSLHNWMECDLL